MERLIVAQRLDSLVAGVEQIGSSSVLGLLAKLIIAIVRADLPLAAGCTVLLVAVSSFLRRWWQSLKESDDRDARDSYPNATGGFALLLAPLRRYVLVVVVILIPVLIAISIVR